MSLVLDNVRVGIAGTGIDLVRGVSLALPPGETLGIAGESGSGKSLTAQAAMGLLAPGLRLDGGILLDGMRLDGAEDPAWQGVRGRRIAYLFQEPMSVLNPVQTVGRQIADVAALHQGLSRAAARAEALGLMQQVGIPDPERRAGAYPQSFSGGQAQRICLAVALAGKPDYLIADEPTTALDVTVQARILDLLMETVASRGMGMMLISHDLDLVAERCGRIAVFYAGRVVETGETRRVLSAPRHPYTAGLLEARPRIGHDGLPQPIPGQVPDLTRAVSGCAFAPRCPRATERCRSDDPGLEDGTACFHPLMP
ncbi:MAG: ABC transporter ATP-binding protein [Alphaproteobacteria bacterium]|nr:ABC transporter ATP-binding protein [Alphaproteobacteria bacterium]